jgi:hypothetical protein
LKMGEDIVREKWLPLGTKLGEAPGTGAPKGQATLVKHRLYT